MIAVIILLSVILTFIVILATYKPTAKYKYGMLFSVKLPPHAMEHPEIPLIQARFNREFNRLVFGMALLLIPLVLLYKWTAYQFIYFLAWLTVFFIVTAVPFRRAFRDTLALKKAGDWGAGKDDGDEYWANGFTYHHPQDRRVFVEKRVGVGLTVNTGTVAGKMIAWGAAALFAAVVLGVSFMLIRSELTPPVLAVTPENRVEIDYWMYNDDFAVSEIERLALIGQMPSGTRTNGEATDKVARGNFQLKEWGKSRLYIYKNNPPYIQIKLPDVYIFYNEKNPEQTRLLFERLQRAMNSVSDGHP